MQIITQSTIVEHSAITLMARIVDADGEPIEVADIDTMSVQVWDTSTGERTGNHSPDSEDVILDELSTNNWTEDSIGFNFKMVLSGDNFPEGSTYRVEIKFQPVDADSFYALWELEATPIYSEPVLEGS